jgi:hypothetical protein
VKRAAWRRKQRKLRMWPRRRWLRVQTFLWVKGNVRCETSTVRVETTRHTVVVPW